MVGNEFIHRRNSILFILLCVFYFIQVIINIYIEGFASILPPAFLFIVFGAVLTIMIHKSVNPKITMYVMISCVYIYYYFLINDSPYLVNYLFMWLALPLSAIYQNSRVVLIAGATSIFLTLYSFFYFHNEIFPNVGKEDLVYLVLFGVFLTAFLYVFIHRIKEANAKLQEAAYRDSLTGAANRLLLKEKFELLILTQIHSIGLLFVDFNNFKKINDTYGHDVGDELLKIIVLRVNSVLKDTDLLVRLGGDEFIILASNVDNSVLQMISKRIHSALETPIVLNDQIINTSASIGWYYTTDVLHADLETMMKEADRAMYKAKGSELIGARSSGAEPYHK